MKEITEDYVSFEVAKLLKEKGFDGQTSGFYYLDDSKRIFFDCLSSSPHIPAPTLQMAMKWVRETYNIHIVPFFDKLQDSDDLPYSFTLYLVSEYCATIEKTACFDIDENYYWQYPEQACEAAIKYCLENII